MPGVLPDGQPVPTDGSLPEAALAAVGERGFGVYVHVPFCASRCGYCDFNTYTAAELLRPEGIGRRGQFGAAGTREEHAGGSREEYARGTREEHAGGSREEYVEAVLAELTLAARVLGDVRPPRVDTVFVGGGTPTLLPAGDLARILDRIDATWGLAPDAEVTTEANPESVTPASLKELHAAGYSRISLGMQSVAPGVLAVLDRRHTSGRAVAAAAEARDAGFDHVNLDLIYGTPGESAEDFTASLAAAVRAGVDHVSAYALIVEDGTRLAARMRRGELPYPSQDVAADRYLAAEAALGAAGFSWYEVSNWARTPAARCRHNLLYWTGGDWWGLGPGAHSHVGGVRWWNVKHPAAYAARLAAGASPGGGREILTPADRYVEEVMLRLRLGSGLPLGALDEAGRAGAERARSAGLLGADEYAAGSAVLTLRGRLLADAVVRDLLP